MPRHMEKETCISGIGQSSINRKPGAYPFKLAVDACRRAIADAGLTPDQIDGAACWPGGVAHVGEGSAAASVSDIKNSLGLKLNWYSSGEGAAMFAPVVNAIGAIAAGYATHVLVWRAMGERWIPMYSHANRAGQALPPTGGWMQWTAPYWAASAANWTALIADLHMRKYGITREQMAAIPIVQRRNAGLNPHAIYREPLTLDDYMQARMITTPFCIYDCDVPCDGATAMIISRLDAAKDESRRPIRFEAVGSAATDRMDTWFARDDFPHMMMHDAARSMWARTDLKPKDVGSAHLYDGFTYLAMLWIEALGFVPEGEVGRFIEGGQRIALDGELALNTNGGQLSEGRLHGLGHLHEAVLQLRGEAGERQVKDLTVSVAGVGGGSFGGSLLLTNQD
jgi:acetyl-CoA acetyltransferase